MARGGITFRRDVLLVEIERRCGDALCNARARIGLTKDEARVYQGFECERCERWNEDVLSERDIPEWWEELKLTSLDGVRALQDASTAEPGEVVTRLSDAWRDVHGGTGRDEEDGDGG
ncbi:MAG TPA: hypothetical protein VGB73_17855 [Pyrinomonadaceae bacterium]|jgi:hypothetical protein